MVECGRLVHEVGREATKSGGSNESLNRQQIERLPFIRCVERWQSGRMRQTRNLLCGFPYREFESHSLRQ